MHRVLVVTCGDCGKARELFNPRLVDDRRLGEATRAAVERGDHVQLESGAVEIGCECEVASASEVDNSVEVDSIAEEGSNAAGFQINLQHVLLIVTTCAIVLGIFRRPIGMLFTENTRQWAMLPWSFFGWVLFGTEVIDKQTLTKEPVGIAVFTINVVIAMILPMVLFIFAKDAFLWSWKRAGSQTSRKPE